MRGWPDMTARLQSRFRPFLIAAIASAAVMIGFIAWTGMRVGGDAVTVAVEDFGQALAALVAAAACIRAGQRSSDRLRKEWWLLAASAASWFIGETIWSVYEVGAGIEVPFPSIADVGFVVAVPLAIAGILAFPSAAQTANARWRAQLDGAMIASASLFIGWSLGIGDLYQHAALGHAGRLLSLAYPAGD